jgi:hypothetical protein
MPPCFNKLESILVVKKFFTYKKLFK